MKILLTGASGYLGSALALSWLGDGHQVALLLRSNSKLDRLRGLESSFDVGRCKSDGEIEDFIKSTQPDIVVHTAGVYGRKGETALQLFDANQRLGLIILQVLKNISRPVTFINTSTILAKEVNCYALSKYQFSQWGRMLTAQPESQVKFINVLLHNMYGPGDDESKLTTHVLHACQHNAPQLKLTAGEQARDFIYIDDVISAYSMLIKKHNKLEIIPDIELGSGVATTIRQFVETTHRLTASRTELIFGALPYRANEVMHCVADLKFMSLLDWIPAFDLNAGLKKTIEKEFGS